LRIGGENEMVIHNGVTYNANDLTRIGNNVASIWGGFCRNFTVDGQNQKVTFNCVEHGEEFASELDYDELHEYQ